MDYTSASLSHSRGKSLFVFSANTYAYAKDVWARLDAGKAEFTGVFDEILKIDSTFITEWNYSP